MKDDFSNIIIQIYAYIKEHYYFYIGVLMRVCFEKFSLSDFLRYVVASFLLVQVTKHILEIGGSSEVATIFVCIVLGFMGHSGLKYTIDEAMPRIFKAITDKIVDIIKKK